MHTPADDDPAQAETVPPTGADVRAAAPAGPSPALPTGADVRAPAGPSPALPTRLGGYRVDGLLGRGGMGEVYRAFDERLRRPVALKRISTERQGVDAADARARFWREARALAALSHPGVVHVYEIGETPEGDLFLAMELVDGRSLSQRLSQLRDRPFSAEAAAALGIQAARALGAAHAAGLVHRDVKPGNLLLPDDGQLRVVDFGLARQADVGRTADDRVTETGAVLGTPAYMAPEQVAGAEIGPPADVFALGIVLYRLLAGTHPFVRESSLATALALAAAHHVPLAERSPGLPAALTAVVARCLALHAKDRFADGNALADALEAAMPQADMGVLRHFLGTTPRPDSPGVAGADRVAPGSAPPGLPPPGPAPNSLPAATLATPASIPAATAPVSPPIAASPFRSLRWLLGGLAVAGAAFLVTRPGATASDPSDGARPQGAAAPVSGPVALGGGPQPPGLVLPPRPVVAIIGFEAPDDDPEDPRGAVLAEALRTMLDTAPERLVTLPLSAIEGVLSPSETIGMPPGSRTTDPAEAPLARSSIVPHPAPDFDVRRLRRPNRGPGHVDLAVFGRIVDLHGTSGDSAEMAGTGIDLHLVNTETGETVRTLSFTSPRGDDPIALAWELGPPLAAALGTALPPGVEPPTRSASAWGALLQAHEALRAGEMEAASRNLDWALKLDPAFSLARLERLQALRMLRDDAGLAALAPILAADLEKSDQGDHVKDLALVWVALAAKNDTEALRRLNAVLERFPTDVSSLELLLALRFSSPELRDLAEVERVARALLAVAPRNEEAASRLVRALAWRGRAAEADTFLASLGLPTDDPAFLEVFAEQDLYAGRFDVAQRRFQAALARSPDDLYAEHMGIAARLLSGDCPGAAVAALDRIDRIEAAGREANLDWTYSLAVQSLICADRLPEASRLSDRWSARSASGKAQVQTLRLRTALLDGTPPARIVRDTLRVLGSPELLPENGPELLGILARLGTDVGVLRANARRAETSALATTTSPAQRSRYLDVARALTLRAASVEGSAALDGYAKLVHPWSELRGEGDLGARVWASTLRAEALAAAGNTNDARAVWGEIVGLGYPRLWSNDLWLSAKRRLARPQPTSVSHKRGYPPTPAGMKSAHPRSHPRE